MENINAVSSQSRQHIVWLDVVRFVAMFTVVCCHSADPFNYSAGNVSADAENIKLWGAIYGGFLRPCVPLFVMITGALLLPVRGETSVFYRKRISRVFWPFLIWSALYNLFPYLTRLFGCGQDVVLACFPYANEEVMGRSLGVSLKYISEVPLNFSAISGHMWYIYLLIGMYLYMPIFSAWVEKASEKAKRWFLIAWGVTLFVPYYRVFIDQYIWGACSWNEFYMLYNFAGFNGYLLLGHYLRHHDWSLSKILVWGIPMFLIGYAITFFGFRYMTAFPDCTPEEYELFWYYCSPNVVMMTMPLFLLLKKVKVTNLRIQKALANLTVCGFGVYMIHFFLTGPGIVLARYLHIPIPLQIFFSAVVAFFISWLLVIGIRKISGKYARYIVG